MISYASDSGAARDLSTGAKARERSERAGEGGGGGVVSPSHGREIFENSCMKTAFSGVVYVVV